MDRFDDIWKDRFNEEDLPVDDWNTPDDEVWKGILPHVAPQKKEKKRRWWWLWFEVGSLLLIAIVLLLLPSQSDVAVISQDSNQRGVTEISTTATTTSTNDPNIVSTGVNTFNGKNNSSVQSSKSRMESETISVNVSPSNEADVPNGSNVNTLLQMSVYTKRISDIPISNITIANAEIETKTNLKSNSPGFSTLKIFKETKTTQKPLLSGKNDVNEKLSTSMLPSLEALLQERILPTNLAELELLEIVPPSEGKLALGFSTGAVFWKHRISNNYTTLLSPFDFNYEDGLGWQANLNATYAFNEFFEGIIGFQYEQINTKSGHNSDITYSIDNEVDAMNPLNGYALSLATPYGLSGATFNFIRSQDLAANSADLLVDFHSTHVIKNISIPIGMNIFPFGKKNIWVPSVHLGFGTNYLASISNNIQSIETNHDAIQYDDSGTSTFVSPELEKWHFDYRLGLGVTYQLNSKSSLQLNYDWSRGINPIFKLEDYNTRIDRHHLTLGFRTKLGKP